MNIAQTNLKAGRALEAAQTKFKGVTKLSAEAFERAPSSIPSGVGSNVRYTEPHPIFVREAKGGTLWDIDGREYIDCRLGFGPIILGHGAVNHAIEKALARGCVYALPYEGEAELAEKIKAVIPGAEMVSFCSTGNEATLNALRLARAYTGRSKIAKFEGGFHGVHDGVLVSVHYDGQNSGLSKAPAGRPESPGVLNDTAKNTVVLPYNSSAAFDIIENEASDLAAVIVEPVQGAGGSITPSRSFLMELRRLTERLGIVLIFDEVITGFRLALGGGQEHFGITADLATFGKAMGGGLPIACVTGSREIMQLISVPEARRRGSQPVWFGGTFNSNPVSVAAASATLDLLRDKPGLYATLNANGDRIRSEVSAFAAQRGLPLVALGVGSLFSFRFVTGPIENIRDFANEDPRLPQALYLGLLVENVLTHPRHNFLCHEHTDADVDAIIAAHCKVIGEIADA